MKTPMNDASADIETLVEVIAASPIVVPDPLLALPAGFDEVDAAILQWIAAEAMRRRRLVAMM
jgi:hypothetical protein